MIRKKIWLLLTVIILMVFSSMAYAENPQLLLMPSVYKGNVANQSGASITSGTVKAFIDGEQKGEVSFQGGKYERLMVPGIDSDIGKTVTFKVVSNGVEYDAAPTPEVTWRDGALSGFDGFPNINLKATIVQTPATPTAPADPTASPAPGKFSDSTSVSLSCATAGAKIYYTTDGTDPKDSQTRKEYTGQPFLLSVTTTVKAVAQKDNTFSEVKTFTYENSNTVKLTVSPTTLSLAVGGTSQISVTTDPSGATLSYSANDAGIASVSSSGLVSAVSKGNTSITVAASRSGYREGTYVLQVTVTEAATPGGGTPTGTTPTGTTPTGTTPTGTTPTGTTPTGTTQQGKFVDVPADFWAYSIINGLNGKGLVGGYPGGYFKPENNISRAEFIKILTGAIKLAEDKTGEALFSDVASGEWYYGSIQAAAKAGLSKGYDTGEFRPDAQITRQEMAVILIRAMGKEKEAMANAEKTTAFADDGDIAPWARGFVVTAVGAKLVNGYPDNTFGPNNFATRAEACAMINGLLNKI